MSFQAEFTLPRLDKVTSEGQAVDLAIEYQDWASEQDLSYGEVVYYTNYFEEVAKKFNLTDEFRENGIL